MGYESSYFSFGIHNNRLRCIQGQKTLNFLIICIYFYLICSQMIHFCKSLLCVTLLCSDWSISFKAERSVTLCTALPWKQSYKSGNKWAGNMLMFHVDVKQGLVLKTTRFNDSESTLSVIQSRLFQWFRVDSFNDSESTPSMVQSRLLSMVQSRLFQWFRVDSFNGSESTLSFERR